jgi:uncharacterized protein YdeI (YjbR/CyaY-like superfamily)
VAAEHTAELIVTDVAAWADWLGGHHDEQAGVWLVLARKGTTEPTSLSYDQALDEALCHGWIDGQRRGRDDRTYQQRFTPRRPRSVWSARNVGLVERLTAEGRMRPAGLEQVRRATDDGRLAAAYAGSKTIVVPDDLQAALDARPDAAAMWAVLTSQNRFAVLYRLQTAKRPETRQRRLGAFVEMLADGRSIYPQEGRPRG